MFEHYCKEPLQWKPTPMEQTKLDLLTEISLNEKDSTYDLAVIAKREKWITDCFEGRGE